MVRGLGTGLSEGSFSKPFAFQRDSGHTDTSVIDGAICISSPKIASRPQSGHRVNQIRSLRMSLPADMLDEDDEDIMCLCGAVASTEVLPQGTLAKCAQGRCRLMMWLTA